MGSALLVAALSGCSAIKLGYNSLPNLSFWWLDRYFDFNDDQEARVRQEIDRLQAWHRAQELPRAAELLSRLEPMASRMVTAEQACEVLQEARARVTAVVDEAEPTLVSLAATLDTRQLRYLQRRFDRNNAEFRKEAIDAPSADRLDRRYRQWRERLETLYGTLEPAQRSALRVAIEQSAYDPQRMLAERQRRQQDLIATLTRLQDATLPSTTARSLMRGYFERVLQSPDPAFRRLQDTLTQESCRTFSVVHELATPSQRAHALRRITGWQRELRELSAS